LFNKHCNLGRRLFETPLYIREFIAMNIFNRNLNIEISRKSISSICFSFIVLLILVVTSNNNLAQKNENIVDEKILENSDKIRFPETFYDSINKINVADSNITLISRLSYGNCTAIASDTSYTYINKDNIFQIIQVLGTNDIIPRGEIELPSNIQDIVIKNNYAFIADGIDGLRIIKISDPSKPVEIGYNNTGGEARRVAIWDKYAFISEGRDGFRIVDISVLDNPIEIGHYSTNFYTYDLAIKDNFAYVADGVDGIGIIDISDPHFPIKIDSVQTDSLNQVVNIKIKDSIAYALTTTDGFYPTLGGLNIFNISNPTDPVKIGFCGAELSGYNFILDSNFIFIANYHNIKVVDISNVENPHLSHTYSKFWNPVDLVKINKTLFVSAQDNGLRMLTITDNSKLSEAGYYVTGGWAQDKIITNNYAYIADRDHGIQIVDISNIYNPVIVGFSKNFNADKIVVKDNKAYVSSPNDGIHIIDISNPRSPTEIGVYNNNNYFYIEDMTIKNNYIYIANHLNGLRIIDASKNILKEVGSYAIPNELFNSVTVNTNNLACLTSEYGHVHILNVSDVTNPTEIGLYNLESGAIDIDASDNYVFIGTVDGLRILDITNPSLPFEVGVYPSSSTVYHVLTYNNYAVITLGNQTLQIIDISEPNMPKKIASFNPGRPLYDIDVNRNLIFTTQGPKGLFVLKSDLLTGIITQNSKIFNNFDLLQNYPNPFNPTTKISFTIPPAGDALYASRTNLTLKIYDILGNEIATLVNEQSTTVGPGEYEVEFDGASLTSGVYFYQLKIGEFVQTKKMLLLK